MTKNQEDTLNMYQATNDVLQTNLAVWTANVPFSAAVTLLDANIDSIEDLRDIQDADTSGVAEDKQNKRQDLEEKTFAAGSILKFYASSVNNRELLEKVNFGRSQLSKSRDNELPGMAGQVHQEAVANAVAVLPFGLTALMAADLDAANSSYVKYISKPRAAKTGTSAATEQLPDLFESTGSLLSEQLDGGMELYRTSNPAFYTGYFNARIIVNSPTLKRALQVRVVNSAGVPLEHVKVLVDGGINRRSSSLGNIRVQTLSEGSHSLTATLPGYAPASVNFNVILGETTKLTLTMTAV